MARNIVTGIDVGTHTIRVVVAELTPRHSSPRIIGTGIAESRGLRHGYIVNHRDAIKSIRAAVRAAERTSGVRVRSTFLSIGGISLESTVAEDSILITRADNEVTPMDVDGAIRTCQDKARLVNKKVIENIPLRYKLDGQEVYGSPIGMKGTKLEVRVLFITCLDQHFDELVATVEDAGIDVEDVIPAPIAASLVALSKRQRAVGCLLANIGAETVSIAVFEDDVPVSLQVFPIGSTDITNDIALGFQIPLEEAEIVKLKGSTALPKKKLSEIIDARLSDIFELIESHLKKIGRSGLLPAGIVLTGGGVGISTIEDFAKGSLKLPSSIATPTLSSAQETFQDSSWFVAYGLCIFGFSQGRSSKAAKKVGTLGKGIWSWFKQFLP